MPKTKKKINQKLKQVMTGAHALKDALVLGNRMGETRGAFERSLCVSDETPLRERERKLNPLEKKVFRTWFLCYVPYSALESGSSESLIDYVMKNNDRTFRAIITAAAIGSFQEIWTADGKTGLPELGIDNVGNRFVDCVDETFRNDEAAISNEAVRDLLFSDYVSLRMSSIVNWDRMLCGNNVAVWSKNCLSVLERFASGEQLKYLRERRDAIVLELSDISVSIIKEALAECAEEMRRNGLPCSYHGTPYPAVGSMLPFSSAAALAMLPDKSSKRPSPAQQPVLNQATEYYNEAMCECAVSRLAYGFDFESICPLMTRKFSHLEIFYAAISLLAGYRAVSSAPAAIQSLFAFIVFMGFPTCVDDYGYTARDYRKCVTLHPAKMIELTDKQKETMRIAESSIKRDPRKAKAVILKNVNLAQLIYSTTGVVAPPVLTLPLRESRVLESYGLSRTEAIALCGYIGAMRHMRRTADFMADNFVSSEWMSVLPENDEKMTEEENRAAIRQEVETELKKEIAEAKKLRESTESVQRRLMREHRTATYRAEKAEMRVESLQKENAELREQIEALSSERNQLQSALVSVTDLGADDESDEAINVQFPCDIGKGIRYIVFGGSQNWIAEQRRRFPYIDFYEKDELPNAAVIGNADILLLNTHVMHHNYFGMIQEAAKKNNIPLQYFNSKGINRGSARIIEAYKQHLSQENAEV